MISQIKDIIYTCQYNYNQKNNQTYYKNKYNFIEAPNNDGPCEYNKATYSSELVKQLLDLYAYKDDVIVYDPFMGTGTTANACKTSNLKLDFIGSEISLIL